MTAEIEIDAFWEAVAVSGLLPERDLSSARSTLDTSVENPSRSASAIAGELVRRKRLTPYQAKILLAGHSGPFRYGSYLLLKQIDAQTFAARHSKTGFGVWLHFFPGTHPADLKRWDAVETRADELSRFRHASALPVFESLVTPQYRFIVTGRPRGKTLRDQLPPGKRIPPRTAARVTASIARGVAALHRRGMVAGPIDPARVWIQSGTATQFLPNLLDDSDELTPADDSQSVAALFYRIVTGAECSDNDSIETSA